MIERWYDKSIQQVERQLNTSSVSGLSRQKIRSGIRRGYTNVIFPIPHRGFDEYLKKVILEPTMILLLVCALLAAFLEHITTAYIIIGIISVNVLLSSLTYTKAQQVLEDLGHLSIPTSKVIRDGKLYLINSEQLAEGDLILLSAGDMVPCDARLTETDDFSVLEVNLTGAIRPVEKDAEFIKYGKDVPPSQQTNMIFASSIVTKGNAKAICCCTGEDTLVCKLKKNKSPATHDNIKEISLLEKYGKAWSLLMISAIFLLVAVYFLSGTGDKGLFEVFILGLSLAAASSGELHVASAYVIIANGLFNAVKQKKDINTGALIKNVSKIEDLKQLTALIVNKEGAFSVRGQKVEKVYVNGYLYDKSDIHYIDNCGRVMRYALISTGLYGANKLVSNNLSKDNLYSPEEEAIIDASRYCKVYNISLDREYPLLDRVTKGEISRFDTTLVNERNEYTVSCRGDLDGILSQCAFYCENGRTLPFDPDKKIEIISEAAKLSRNSYKIIGVASKKTHYNNLRRIVSCQSEMIFEGFLAIRESLLPGAAHTVKRCRDNGIRVIMVCDDVGENNVSLAQSLGIIKNADEAITGRELSMMRDEMFRVNIGEYSLYQGISVHQKRKLLDNLRSDGEKVGVLAQELDEIILLRESDVGFIQSTTLSARGGKEGIDVAQAKGLPVVVKNSKDSRKSGSEAMKFVSDVIISDADMRGNGGFNAIAESIWASRAIYRNLVRMVKYILTSQIMRLLLVLFSIVSKTEVFIPQQIVFCGLICDFFAMIAVSFEHYDPRIIGRKEDFGERLDKFSHFVPFSVLSGVVWAGCISLLALLLKALGNDVNVIAAAVFLSVITSQIIVLNELLRDSTIFRKNISYNRAHILTVLFTVLFIAFSFLVPAFGSLISLFWPGTGNFFLSLIPSGVMLIVYEIQKIINGKKE